MIRSLEELKNLLDEEDVLQARELLDHPAWVLLESYKSDAGDELSVYGPFESAADGFVAAAALEATARSAPMHADMVARYGNAVYQVVPLWGQL